MNKEESKVLTRMRLSCCWGDNLNEKELNEVVNYINWLQAKVNQLETNRDEAIEYLKCALDEEKETPSKHDDWRLDLLEILERGKE